MSLLLERYDIAIIGEIVGSALAMRSMANGAGFHLAYQRARQQAFLEGHEHAFRFFGGTAKKYARRLPSSGNHYAASKP